MVTVVLLFAATVVLCVSTQMFLYFLRRPVPFTAGKFSRQALKLERSYKLMACGLAMGLSFWAFVISALQLVQLGKLF